MTALIPRVRAVRPEFAKVPRYWLGGSPLATHIANGVNLLFPAGERFFVRSVKHYLEQITDPTLRAQVRGFFGQEGRHSHAHDEYNRILESHGYQVRGLLAAYEWFAFRVVERLSPPSLRLAATAAAEHFTAILAENALREGILEKFAHPEMAKLLLWHAAEEIEHKAVAFDVLQQVNPSYAVRVGGLALSAAILAGFWVVGSLTLAWQDRAFPGRPAVDPFSQLPPEKRPQPARRVFWQGIREYLKRDFHPNQRDNLSLARDFLQRRGMQPSEEVAPAPA
jgi:hypothetical protein